ncbi:MAG: hypothetical protein AB8B71_15460 [Paracoccaceae bacterium]
MMPRSVLLTTGFLTAFAAVLGVWMGLNWQPLDETQVISKVAELYASQTGRAASECVAVPGEDPVWVRVMCRAVVYELDHRGRIVRVSGPGA